MTVHRQWTNCFLAVVVVCFPAVMLGDKCIPDPHPSTVGRQYWRKGYALQKAHNLAAAIPLYVRAAELDDECGQLSLGFLYANGIGVQRDYEKAVSLWRQSADHKNAAAEYSLGLMYGQGKGVPFKDKNAAMKWLERAAEHGDRTAMGTLGLTYSGCELDRLEHCKHKEDMGRATDEESRRRALEWLERAKQNAGARGWQAELDRNYLIGLWYPTPEHDAGDDSRRSDETPLQAAERVCRNTPNNSPGYSLSRLQQICKDAWLSRHGYCNFTYARTPCKPPY